VTTPRDELRDILREVIRPNQCGCFACHLYGDAYADSVTDSFTRVIRDHDGWLIAYTAPKTSEPAVAA
jgi:hypothetical protein